MGNSNIFSTNRPMSFQEKLDMAVAEKRTREQNMAALRTSVLESKEPDTSTLDDIDKETEKKLQTEAALEKARLETAMESRIRGLAGLEKRLFTEGCELLWRKVLFETVYDSCWIDSDVKETLVESMYDRFKATLEFVDVVCESSRTKTPTRMIQSIQDVIVETADKAAKRIAKEAKDDPNSDPSKLNFDLTDDEEAKMDENLADLGKDEIVELVKDKVLTTVQDEKEASKKKSEELKELEPDDEDEEDESDDDTDDTDTPDDDSEDSDSDKKKDKEDKDEDDEKDEDDTDEEEGKKEVEEGLSQLTDPAPSDFYDCVANLYTKLYKKSGGNNASDYGIKLTKGSRVNIMDKQMIKRTGKRKFERILDIKPNDAITIIRSCGFKEGNAKILHSGRFFIKKLRDGYCELQITEAYKSEAGSTRMGVSTGNVGEWATTSNTYSSNYNYLKQSSIKVVYRSHATDSIRTRYAIEGTEVIGKTEFQINLENLSREKKIREINNSYGESIFESLLMYSKVGVENDAVMEGVSPSTEDVYNAALLETVLSYTVLETLNTMGIYNFTTRDTSNIRKALLEDMNALSMKMGQKGGKKVTRIGTMKFKRNNDKQIMKSKNSNIPDTISEDK